MKMSNYSCIWLFVWNHTVSSFTPSFCMFNKLKMLPWRTKPVRFAFDENGFWKYVQQHTADEQKEAAKLSPDQVQLIQELKENSIPENEEDLKENEIDAFPDVVSNVDIERGQSEMGQQEKGRYGQVGFNEDGEAEDSYICHLPTYKLRFLLFRAGMTDYDCCDRNDILRKARQALQMIDNGTATPSRRPMDSDEEIEDNLIRAEKEERLLADHHRINYENLKMPFLPPHIWAENMDHGTPFGEVLMTEKERQQYVEDIKANKRPTKEKRKVVEDLWWKG